MQVSLNVVSGPHEGRKFSFTEHDNFIVGRGKQAHFRLPRKDPFFSRIHFMVEINPPHCRLMDMQSTNGTSVNEQRVRRIDLKDGDLIHAGSTVIEVSIERGGSTVRATGVQLQGKADSGTNANACEPKAPNRVKSKQKPYPSKHTRKSESSAPVSSQPPNPQVPVAPVANVSTLEEPAGSVLPPDYAEKIAGHSQPIPGYRLIEEIGRGGMGVVYLALGDADGQPAAIKTIKPAVEASPDELQRFTREAEILQELAHPHIVRFRQMGEADGLLYFAMQYVDGSDASRLLKRDGPMAVSRAVALISQILEALDYAHAKGFVHRDIKPANLLVTTRDRQEFACLSDFGLARQYQSSKLSGLTMMGDMAGTAPFMPPEQITHYRDAKPPADQYSAAATLYNLLTGRHVYDLPDDIGGQLMLILQETPIPIRRRRKDIPKGLEQLISKALAREPADRFDDVAAMRKALERYLG